MIYSRTPIALRAEDSTIMVMMDVYKPPGPDEAPMAFRMFLLCRASRAMIMSVRRRLSEREIARYEVSKVVKNRSGTSSPKIPVTVSATLAENITVDLRRTRDVPIVERYIRHGKAITQ
jgi:hypothetical protein